MLVQRVIHAGFVVAAFAGCPGVGDGVDAGPPVDAGDVVGDAGTNDDDAGPSDVDAGPPFDAGPLPAGTRVRVVAANLTSENLQSWDPGHGQRILQGLQPDIVLLQELNVADGSTSALSTFIAATLGAEFSVFREPTAGIPNGIASRWPILESGVWDDSRSTNREFVYARIDVPGPVDLWAVSLHLLTANATTRESQVEELLAYVSTFVPDDDFLVLGGDLNTNNASEPALTALSAAVSLAHTPVDQNGESGTNAQRERPFDWVLPDNDLDAFHFGVVLAHGAFPPGLVVDTRLHTPLSDLAPARVGDSGAPSMQHMAVVKDFYLPE